MSTVNLLAAGGAERPPTIMRERLQPLLQRFRVLGDASEAELAVLVAGLSEPVRQPVGQDILADAAPHGSAFLLKGWAASVRLLRDGRRQVLRLIVPGDLVGRGAGAGVNGGRIVALTPVETTSAGAAVEAAWQSSHSGLRRALARGIQADEQLLLDQITRLGRLSGAERLADLLLELRDRLALVGLGDRHRFPMPLTQDVIADALGLSIVHVSRLKGELGGMGLLHLRAGMAVLPDPQRLANLACRGA